MNKGMDELCQTAAGWLGRRFALPRPIDPATEVLVLNEWAGRILDLLDGSKTLAEIASSLGAEYESEAEAIQSDVIRFATELQGSGLGELVLSDERE